MLRQVFIPLLLLSLRSFAQGGGCIPPTASFTSTAGDTARICQGEDIGYDGNSSQPAPGRSIESWVWHIGAIRDTSAIALAVFSFPDPGVYPITLEVLDDIGCSSGESTPMYVLVSGTPDFSGTVVPETACAGEVIQLHANATVTPLIQDPVACTNAGNGIPLIDDPTPSISLLQVTGQANGVLEDIAELGDICMEIEHSYMGDLVLTVTCPNGQSVVLHQQGGGGTFLGDANDSDGGEIVPGNCFQYCFGLAPEFGLMSAVPTTIPVSQGNALLPGRYTPVQPLMQLLGCPLNGTWSFSSQDLFGADNGYLCGWCISFGESPDSSFIDLTPALGTSSDSSFWSGSGVSNTVGVPGAATMVAEAGQQNATYTVVDDFGCEHQAIFPILVGESPVVSINNNVELGLLCAQPSGAFSYQWSYNGQPVVGAEGACYTPPGNGPVSVTVATVEGCEGTATLLTTGITDASLNGANLRIVPFTGSGTFRVMLPTSMDSRAVLRIFDAQGRAVHTQAYAVQAGSITVQTPQPLCAGVYVVNVVAQGLGLAGRMFVE